VKKYSILYFEVGVVEIDAGWWTRSKLVLTGNVDDEESEYTKQNIKIIADKCENAFSLDL
jgi:hypothetical protein